MKQNFPNAIFFGFTGTPIHIENQIKGSTTADVFGNELHRYSIADGIRDENVLGFDPYKVLTYRDKDVRKAVALDEAKAATEQEAIADPHKSKIYYRFMVDGGVRSGADVFKMLALGADLVGIGRPIVWAAIGGGTEGVSKYIAQVKGELVQTMVLTGCKNIAAINEDVLFA